LIEQILQHANNLSIQEVDIIAHEAANALSVMSQSTPSGSIGSSIPSSIQSSCRSSLNPEDHDDAESEDDEFEEPEQISDANLVHCPQSSMSTRKQCKFCYRKKNGDVKKIAHKSSFYCSLCRKYLCMANGRNCFLEYHIDVEKKRLARPKRVNNLPNRFHTPVTGVSLSMPGSSRTTQSESTPTERRVRRKIVNEMEL
jgi:hypothetical protein